MWLSLKTCAAGAGALALFGASVCLGNAVAGVPRAVSTPDAGPAAPSLLAPPPWEKAATSADDYRLRRADDGSGDLIYEAPGFSARVGRDGSVTFRDHRVSAIKLLPFLPGPPPTGVPTLEGTLRGLGKKGRARPPGPARDPKSDAISDETRDPSTAFSRYRPDPRELCQYPRPCFYGAPVFSVGARANLDVTDELMRLHGQDPYRYEKARFLTATREMRVRRAARAHAEDLARGSGELRQRLQLIACDAELQPTERRAVIEALRAELDTGTPEGRTASGEIERFIAGLGRHDAGAACPAAAPVP